MTTTPKTKEDFKAAGAAAFEKGVVVSKCPYEGWKKDAWLEGWKKASGA